jgi:hypothetical protein
MPSLSKIEKHMDAAELRSRCALGCARIEGSFARRLPELTYGHALESLSDLHANASKFAIAMPTTSKVEEMNRPIKPGNESQCPYGLEASR